MCPAVATTAGRRQHGLVAAAGDKLSICSCIALIRARPRPGSAMNDLPWDVSLLCIWEWTA